MLFLRIRVSTIIRMFVIFTYPGFDQHRGWLIQLRKGTAAAHRAALARMNGLSGAMSSCKQYHGCRDEQQLTYCAF
jgi:hypothetical protein